MKKYIVAYYADDMGKDDYPWIVVGDAATLKGAKKIAEKYDQDCDIYEVQMFRSSAP